jgi:thioredoxin reductase (NADPH)
MSTSQNAGQMPTSGVENVTIIGTGPAGLTAAIYAARANLSPLVIEGEQPGGQLTITSDVENYPGFAEPVLGPDLMAAFRKQSERFGTRFHTGDIKSADLSKRPFTLTLENGTQIKTNTLVVCTGASAKWLGLESEKRLRGRGVSACATCDGFFFRNQEVVVAGGGDTAMEEATFLTRFAKTVTVVHRRDTLRASKIMQEKALKNPKIKFVWDSEITEILGTDGTTGVRVRNLKTNATQDIPAQGFFVAIGHEPNTSVFKGQITTDPSGYILVEPGTTKTNIPGVFAAGDVADHNYRQAVTAAGTGCMAAIDAERFLESGE